MLERLGGVNEKRLECAVPALKAVAKGASTAAVAATTARILGSKRSICHDMILVSTVRRSSFFDAIGGATEERG